MSNKSDGSMGGRAPQGVRQFFHQIALMANSPWGNGPKDNGDGDDRSGPRNPWVTPDPADGLRGRKPRGPSALDELLRKGRGGFGGGLEMKRWLLELEALGAPPRERRGFRFPSPTLAIARPRSGRRSSRQRNYSPR